MVHLIQKRKLNRQKNYRQFTLFEEVKLYDDTFTDMIETDSVPKR